MTEHLWRVRPFDVRKCDNCGEMAFVEALDDVGPCGGQPADLPRMPS